jgi:hypothetical protein
VIVTRDQLGVPSVIALMAVKKTEPLRRWWLDRYTLEEVRELELSLH